MSKIIRRDKNRKNNNEFNKGWSISDLYMLKVPYDDRRLFYIHKDHIYCIAGDNTYSIYRTKELPTRKFDITHWIKRSNSGSIKKLSESNKKNYNELKVWISKKNFMQLK